MTTESTPKKRAKAAKKTPATEEIATEPVAVPETPAAAPKKKAARKAAAKAAPLKAKVAPRKPKAVAKSPAQSPVDEPPEEAPAIKEPDTEEPGEQDPVDEPTRREPGPGESDDPDGLDDAEPPIQDPPADEAGASVSAAAPKAKRAAAKKKAAAKAVPKADSDEDDETSSKPAGKLERLQKILARAGISSRRKAEELIQGGLVQVNGQIVTEMGSKADLSRDHIRVNGKLLQGVERHRYFMLNKPKGYVTTVSDPENRPTVMHFFEREPERLYPVGRLDYLSEGLLLVTNDGDLAHKLTQAASGVEKTYLVKVAGQPGEALLDQLRQGVVIERGRGVGSGRVRTAPAQIRQVRQGDNPWYEVIVIEGRNRELRKLFEEIGHHVEKIRRIGYGPLILDLEPGKLRELDAEEIQSLRLAAEGKLKTRRRRGPAPAQLPKEAGKAVRFKKDGTRPPAAAAVPEAAPGVRKPAFAKPEFAKREFKPAFKSARKPGFQSDFKPEFQKPAFRKTDSSRPAFKSAAKPRLEFDPKPSSRKAPFKRPEFSRPEVPRAEFRSAEPKAEARPEYKSEFNPEYKKPAFKAPAPRKRAGEPAATEYVLPPRKSRPDFDDEDEKPAFNPDYKQGFRTGDKPAGKSEGKSRFAAGGPPKRFAGGSSDRPARDGFAGKKPFVKSFGKPGGKPFARPAAPRSEGPTGESKPIRAYPGGPRIDGVDGASSRSSSRPRPARAASDRPFSARPASGARPFRPSGDRPSGPRPSGPRPPAGRVSGSRPPSSRFGGDSAPREFRPRTAPRFDEVKPAPGGRDSKPSNKLGPDGKPRVKVRHRDSFVGKNKGRPKPKPKSE